MDDREASEADLQEQQRPGPGDASPKERPEDASEADALEQGDLTPPPADPNERPEGDELTD